LQQVHPTVSMILLGAGYSLSASISSPSMTFLVKNEMYIGSAFGLLFSMQSAGVTICNALGGIVMQNSQTSLILFLALVQIAGVGFGCTLNILDRRHNYLLNRKNTSEDKSIRNN